jgi:hypothetical protein
MNHKGIARFGAFNVEGACLRIGPLGALHACGINTARVNRGRDHVVARLDPKHRCMSAGEGGVELFGLKAMGLGETSSSQHKRQE